MTATADDWRQAIEESVGVGADPVNHTPAWALSLVRTMREIGNADRLGWPGPEKAGNHLIGVFGQRETELAALAIIKVARQFKSWKFWCGATAFQDEYEREGRDILVRGGLITEVRAGHFTQWEVTDEFVRRVTCADAFKHDPGWEKACRPTHEDRS